MKTSSQISAFILCGGKSSRMGTDKGHLLFEDKSFTQWAIDAVQPITNSISLVTNHASYAVYQLPILTDIFTHSGPVGAIYTALQSSTTEWNLILNCDTPGITTEALEYLVKETPHHVSASYIMKHKRAYPLIGMYHKKTLPIFKENLTKNNLKLMSILNLTDCYQVQVPQNLTTDIQNINTPEELEYLNFNT